MGYVPFYPPSKHKSILQRAVATPPGPPPGQPLSPQEVTTPVARVGASGALTLIKGYKSNLSSARNVVSVSKAFWAHHEPTIIAALDSCFHALGSSRWQQATLPAGRHRAHSTAGHMEPKPGAQSPRLVGHLVTKVSELSLQSHWVEGHPTTRLLENGAEIRCCSRLSERNQTLLFLPGKSNLRCWKPGWRAPWGLWGAGDGLFLHLSTGSPGVFAS